MSESRIVIADADEMARRSIRSTLETLGYLVVGEASDGQTALVLARQLRPDLVLADMHLLNGLEVAHTLRTEQLAPVILLAAQSSNDLAQQASRAGVLAFLVKPIQESGLMPVIEVVRSRWQRHCEQAVELGMLREQLESRKVIERAKGILMDTQGMNEAEAFRKLQRLAMNNRKTMKEVAQAIFLAQQIEC